ncbi:hypothetical protein EDC04DRAFT_2804803 [Pisolithus marmoratus]|nr:hypothetical protein EDC04DRAFT_2804803 [Pisolithus marmoratus]
MISKDGWKKEALAKLQRVDGFLKESQHILWMFSKEPFITLSHGTFIPKGTYLPHLCKDANVFDPYDIWNHKERRATVVVTDWLPLALNGWC